MTEDKHFTKKGKEMFNIMVNAMGKKKARRVFYSLEKNRPQMIRSWRKD